MNALRFGTVHTISQIRYDGNPKDGSPYYTFSADERLSFAQSEASNLRAQGQAAQVVEVPAELQAQAPSESGNSPFDILLLTGQDATSFQEKKSTSPESELILQALQSRIVQITPTSGGYCHSIQGGETNSDENLPEGTLIKNLGNGDSIWVGQGDQRWMSHTSENATSYVRVDDDNQPVDDDGFPMRFNGDTWDRLDVTR